MLNKTTISIVKDYNILTVFYDDDTKTDEAPQTTDSSAIETILNTAKVGAWEIKVITIDPINEKIIIHESTFPSSVDETPTFESFDFSDFSAEDQTTINNFITAV